MEKSEKGIGERGLGRKGKGGNKDREIIGQYEVGGWQRGEEAPHLAFAQEHGDLALYTVDH